MLKKYWWILSAIIIYFVIFVWYLPEQYILCKFELPKDKEIFEAIKDIRALFLNIGAGILAIIGLYLTWKRTKALEQQTDSIFKQTSSTIQQVDISRDQIAEMVKKNEIDKIANENNIILQQFFKASELFNQSGEENITARLAGIYLFEKIMNKSYEYHLQIIELLTTYIRERRQTDWFYDLNRNLPKIRKDSKPVEKDIQAIITILGRRNTVYEAENNILSINLSGCNLIKSDFSSQKNQIADYSNFDFSESLLFESDFSGSRLNNCLFIVSQLNEANFFKSDLENSNFNGANLEDASIYDANLKNCQFNDSNVHFTNGLTINQLSEVRSIYGIKDLEPNVEKELKSQKPMLFQKNI